MKKKYGGKRIMFGYVTINKGELKVKDYEKYRSYYCGLCHSLKKKYGIVGELTLTYDMTFIAMLLTGLYEEKTIGIREHCIVKPFCRHIAASNKYIDYCADMNMLLAYYKCLDDWEDEKDVKAFVFSGLLKSKCIEAAKKNKRQAEAIKKYIIENKACEEADEKDFDKIANCTGRMLAEILCFKEDEWSPYLRQLGFYLGKFIYLADAYDDLDKDVKNGNYNPLKQLITNKNDIYSENVKNKSMQMLTMMASQAAAYFEKLPIIWNVDVMRNILYSGIWANFNKEQGEKKRERSI